MKTGKVQAIICVVVVVLMKSKGLHLGPHRQPQTQKEMRKDPSAVTSSALSSFSWNPFRPGHIIWMCSMAGGIQV